MILNLICLIINFTELCELLLRWKTNLAKSTDELGRTPLHYLGTSGTGITEVILKHDASSGYCADSEGWLPIHVAASKDRLDIVKKLLEKCPDCISSCNNSGQTFLHVAVQKRCTSVVSYICTKPTFSACRKNKSRFSTILNMRDQNGDTALHLAVQGNGFVFPYLLKNEEVCLSFINKQGYTPLDLASLSIKPALRFRQVCATLQ